MFLINRRTPNPVSAFFVFREITLFLIGSITRFAKVRPVRLMIPRFVTLFLLACLPSLALAVELSWEPFGGHRAARVGITPSNREGFENLPASKTGIRFTNSLADERSLTNQIYLNGSGVAAGDVDGDGLTDLYFCGLDNANALFRNLGGWRFEDITARSRTACHDQASTGAALADIDGDGDLDLLVNGIARGTRLFLNDGRASFTEATAGSGLESRRGSSSLALADVDGDGLLDVYIVNYRNDTMRDMPGIRFKMGVTNGVSHLLSVNGVPASSPDLAGRFTFDQANGVMENGEPDVLFRNLGSGRFKPVDWPGGDFLDESGKPAAIPYDWGLSAMFHDINDDGHPDLYVCNDFQSPDRLWINDGRGRFRAASGSFIRQTSLFSMGVDFADVNRDGLTDFFVADMLARDWTNRHVQVMDAGAFSQVRQHQGLRPQSPRNMLFVQRDDGSFSELARFARVDASDWSWCPVFLDVDLDGFDDLLISTGHWRDAQNSDVMREIENAKRTGPVSPREELLARKRFPRLDTPNAAFRNRGDLTFEERGQEWGFDSRSISHGVVTADLDNDGDLDVIVSCLNDPPIFLQNTSSRPRIAVRLAGNAPNTRGIGAVIRVSAPGLPDQSHEMIAGGRYLSGDDPIRTFAAGNHGRPISISVTWRNRRVTRITNALPDHIYVIHESTSAFAPDADPESTRPTAAFENISSKLNHRHLQEDTGELALQSLLPRRLGTLGPGVAWFDLNGDGWEDLFVGSGRGGAPGVFRNDGKGGFVRQRAAPLGNLPAPDLSTILAWQPDPSSASLLLGVSRVQPATTNAPVILRFSMNTGVISPGPSAGSFSAGPMAMADIDGDGDLDLFVGGRQTPGRFPLAADSLLLRNEAGTFVHEPRWNISSTNAPMVAGAIFTDLNDDAQPELVTAADWGPIAIQTFSSNGIAAWNPPVRLRRGSSTNHLSLSQLTGWWNSIVTADFDNDGRLDLGVGNWGRNEARADHRVLLAYDPTPAGASILVELLSGPSTAGRRIPTRDRATLATVLPSISESFPTFGSFAREAPDRLFSLPELGATRFTEALVFDSIVLLNRGDHLEARPLPDIVQWAPVFGLGAGDIDADGNTDLVISQNFYGTAPGESRQDAGSLLWLKGDGTGGFHAVGIRESGLSMSGEGRGLALADFDRDGRYDVLAAQNGGETLLFRNRSPQRGIRLHLIGSPANPRAIGARARVAYVDDTRGPSHLIGLGSGHWSQDSTTLILGRHKSPKAVEIRWPGGRVETLPLGPEATEITREHP